MNENQTVTRFCKQCGEERRFDLTRITAQDAAGKTTVDYVTGACRTSNHPLDEHDARTAWIPSHDPVRHAGNAPGRRP